MTTKRKPTTKAAKAPAKTAETGGTYYALMDERAFLEIASATELEVTTKLDRETLRAWRKRGGAVVRFDRGKPVLLGDPNDLLADRRRWQ